MTIRAALLAASLTTALLATATPAAQAQTWRHSDAAGDAQVTRYDDDTGELTRPEVDRRERRGDITNVAVIYGARTLRVAVSVRSQQIAYKDLYITVASSRGHTYRILLEDFFEQSLDIERNGYRYTCDGLTSTRTPAGYVVRASRSCFDDAYRVRIGVQTSSGTDFGESDEQTYDDYLRTGRYTEGRPRLGPWILAG